MLLGMMIVVGVFLVMVVCIVWLSMLGSCLGMVIICMYGVVMFLNRFSRLIFCW